MGKKRKAVHGGQTVDGQQMLSGFDVTSIKINYIMDFEAKQGSIAAVLHRGRENALTSVDIEKITGLKRRQITERICYERRHGAPIISDSYHGYWLASDLEEIRRCVTALHLRAGEIHHTARVLSGILEGKYAEVNNHNDCV